MTTLNLEHWWQPFTNVRAFRNNPRIFTRGEGCFLYTEDGRDVLDITAGLWCVAPGHGRPEIADAVRAQMMELDYAPGFQFGNPVTFRFADKLAEHAPPELGTIFFTNSGSESVDTALKIAYHYQVARGKPSRSRLVSRQRGYHGINIGGTSLQGLPNNRRNFPILHEVDFLDDTLDIAGSAFSRGLPERGAQKADQLEAIIAERGADNICAVIVEPVVGAGGMVPPPVGYLQRIREICDAHDILLIFDEVVTGFGRTGQCFASQTFGVLPDLMTTAKAINGGTIPMGAVFMKRHIQQTIFDAAPTTMPELLHGNTYAGSPVAAAAGLAAFGIYEREQLLTRASGPIGKYWEDALHGLRDIDHVIDIRNFGLLGAVTFRSDPERFPAGVGVAVHNRCFENGLLARGVGDGMVMSPPLVISEAEIDLFVERYRKSIAEVLG
ncbi:MAG: aminotransferase class III-fold pyridoxal phosphate-dependent enzyme [Gammaproteobacteria bacterium]|nr:aminotransferase class III-fold pyridoxal phosphate-dependent enzyme [Gammaproteobacteria bacterium]